MAVKATMASLNHSLDNESFLFFFLVSSIIFPFFFFFCIEPFKSPDVDFDR